MIRKLSNKEIIKGVKERDNVTYAYLLQYHKLYMATIMKQGVDREDAKDLIQEVFTSLYDNINSYDESMGCFFTWLMTVMENKAKRLKRHNLMVGHISISKVNSRLAYSTYDRKVISTLAYDEKSKVCLYFTKNLTNEELAIIENVDVSTIKRRKKAIKEMLKQKVTKDN